MQKKQLNNSSTSYLNATGLIQETLRNDMMFHRAMQSSNEALTDIVCALKSLDPNTVKSVTLTNPIDYSAYANKEIILDVKVELNNSELLDIELQLYTESIWEKRSLLYLCRSFDSIGVGDDYNLLKPTTLIAILDGSPFHEDPEFYAHYQLLNVKNFKPYSTLLNINVLYLNRTDIASDKEKEHGLVHWARLFQATTWEELRELCKEHPVFGEVAKVMYQVNASDSERALFEAHRKFVMDKVSLYSAGFRAAREEDQKQIDALSDENRTLSAENKKLQAILNEHGIEV